MSAVHKRLHYAMRNEFKLLARVMSESLPQRYPFSVAGSDQEVMATDFDDRVDIVPVSDPNIFSQAQRIALAQTQMQLAAQAPDLHDMYEAYRRMYQALGVRDVDKILKPKPTQEASPKDPATENIDSLDQVTLKAFAGQDHDAHVMAHLVFGSSPIVAQQPAVAVALQKHVMEHAKIKAQETVQQQMAQQLDMQNITPEVQQQLEKLIAQQVATEMQNVRQLSSQIAGEGQQGPDPLIALKEQEMQIKQQQVQADIAIDQAELQLDQQKAQTRSSEFQQRMDQQQRMANQKLQASAEREILRLQSQTKGPR